MGCEYLTTLNKSWQVCEMKERFIEIPNISLWSQSIGGLIINFGAIEFQSLRWIEKLGGDSAATAARGKKLSIRIDEAVKLIGASSLSATDQARARALWSEAKTHSHIRNRIAHNPISPGRKQNTQEIVLSVIDLKKMAPKGTNPLEPLDYSQIVSVALRVGQIGRELSALIESIP